MRMSELDALFEDESEGEEITAEQDESEESETDNEEEGSTAEPETSEKVADSPEDKLDWAKVAYLDEKRKRQELERRLEALESGGRAESQAQDPDLFADPDTVLRNLEARADSKAFIKVVNFSRDMMMDAKADYKEREAEFVELAKADPSLVDKMRNSDNPAKFAYETAKKHAFLQEVSDPVKYREKIKAELLEELTKTSKRKPSLANTTSVGGLSSAEDNSLTSILGR
jgi:hypothetical protein